MVNIIFMKQINVYCVVCLNKITVGVIRTYMNIENIMSIIFVVALIIGSLVDKDDRPFRLVTYLLFGIVFLMLASK